ncbi:MAG TPA: hypothetical protein IGS53_26950 [Leptolyngbyaceae cyanobacterium M33_DOE_097]|uniref:DUF2808 domain-containing protein n=1 Tax=Oscillatoriales cyanobacterium SpSt-418 TaxID=2282169 RepID=A0A7C3PIJ0_9CYAN|nr:hypothetical protein [Leptolyngbyaceae cyanobacterium M33_DOE_097]
MARMPSFVVVSAAVATSLPILIQPASAQTCTPLQAIGDNTTTVEKSVSPPGTGITRDNWNTDFVVPSDRSFRRYVATIFPLNGGEYNVQMNLKYNNETADTVYNQVAELPERQPFSVTGASRPNANPYQVNLQVGGVPVIGNAYRVSVSACS